jgi:hypothetical protein
MTTKSINDILNTAIVGNHFSDSELLKDIGDFVMSDQPMNDKIKALNMMNKVMGFEENANEVSVKEYMNGVNCGWHHPA